MALLYLFRMVLCDLIKYIISTQTNLSHYSNKKNRNYRSSSTFIRLYHKDNIIPKITKPAARKLSGANLEMDTMDASLRRAAPWHLIQRKAELGKRYLSPKRGFQDAEGVLPTRLKVEAKRLLLHAEDAVRAELNSSG